jgi:phage gp36-like protein
MSLYCTISDLKNAIPDAQIQQLTDDQDTDDIDTEKANYAIGKASNLIDSYLEGRYPVPVVVPIPAYIVDLTVKLAIYYLFKRSQITTLPDPVKAEYDESLETLSQIQRGQISPFDDTVTAPVWFRSDKVDAGLVAPTRLMTNDWQRYPT